MLKITLGQFEPILGKKEENVAIMKRILEKAALQKTDLVLFPELCLTGYFIQDMKEDMAEPIDGPSIRYMQQLCRELDVYTVFSWAELGEDGNIYNSACLISNQGTMVGHYRKVHLYDREKEIFLPGDTFKVFETDLGRIGIMICFDLDFPESARALALQGADVILVPTNNFRPYARYQETYMKSRSMENEVPMAICNRTGREQSLIYFGESAVYDAHGQQLLKLDEGERTETVATPIHTERDRNLSYQQNRLPQAYQVLSQMGEKLDE